MANNIQILVSNSFLFLVVRPGAPFVAFERSVRSKALCSVRSFLFLVVRPGAPSSFLLLLVRHLLLVAMHLFLVASCLPTSLISRVSSPGAERAAGDAQQSGRVFKNETRREENRRIFFFCVFLRRLDWDDLECS